LRPLLASLLLAACTAAAVQAEPPGRFFAWPMDEPALKPRGGTTRGAPVTLAPVPSEAWQQLREAGLSDLERDRRAILAMAGPYRVTFDFLEVVRFDPALKAPAPYQSWATEYVFVAEDRPGFIALQHVLAMRMRLEGDKVSEPVVARHWRQEWRYEADRLLAYAGDNTWIVRAVPEAERRGAWVQSVLQVDDSPRYAARGRWRHAEGASTWISDETWRPLPRREYRRSTRPGARIRGGALRADPRPRLRPRAALLRGERAVLGRGARRLARSRGGGTLQHARAAGPGGAVRAVLQLRRQAGGGRRLRPRGRARLHPAHPARALPRALVSCPDPP
jgi:hypothetical protein